MRKKISNISRLIVPNKKINIFVISILILGVITGSIFMTIINNNDKQVIINKISVFIQNINNYNLDNTVSFKNSIITNFTYVIIIWILGMTIIGVIFNIFMTYIKGFVVGFSLTSFIVMYKTKGVILSFLYLIFGQLLNIFAVLLLMIYSILFSTKLLKQIFKDKTNTLSNFIKKYSFILLIASVMSLVSSILETFVFPSLLKLIVKIFI